MRPIIVIILSIALLSNGCKKACYPADQTQLKSLSVQLEAPVPIQCVVYDSISFSDAVGKEEKKSMLKFSESAVKGSLDSSPYRNLKRIEPLFLNTSPTLIREKDPFNGTLKKKNVVFVIGTVIGTIGFIAFVLGLAILKDEDKELITGLALMLLGAAIIVVSLPFLLVGWLIEKKKSAPKKTPSDKEIEEL